MPSSEATIQFADDALWAACPKCDPVVAAGDVDALVEHVLTTRDRDRVGAITPALMPGVRADLRALYTAFYAGDPKRQADGG